MASGLDTFAAAVEAALLAAWTAAGYPASALAFANVEDDPTGQTVWARCTIQYGSANLATQGAAGVGANTIAGVVFVQLFGAVAEGTGDLRKAADVVRNVFNRTVVGGAQFYAPSVPAQATLDEEDTSWFDLLVSCPFQLDEII